jgi:hypothetical protein
MNQPLDAGQLTFPRDPFMGFVHTFDPILELAISLRQFCGHLIHTSGYIATERGPDVYSWANLKFVSRHQGCRHASSFERVESIRLCCGAYETPRFRQHRRL